MKLCNACGAQLADAVRFCTVCGAMQPENAAQQTPQCVPQQAPQYGQPQYVPQQTPQYGQPEYTPQQAPQYGQPEYTPQYGAPAQTPFPQEAPPPAPKKQGKPIRVLVGVLAALLAVGVGLGVWIYVEKNADQTTAAEDRSGETEKARASDRKNGAENDRDGENGYDDGYGDGNDYDNGHGYNEGSGSGSTQVDVGPLGPPPELVPGDGAGSSGSPTAAPPDEPAAQAPVSPAEDPEPQERFSFVYKGVVYTPENIRYTAVSGNGWTPLAQDDRNGETLYGPDDVLEEYQVGYMLLVNGGLRLRLRYYNYGSEGTKRITSCSLTGIWLYPDDWNQEIEPPLPAGVTFYGGLTGSSRSGDAIGFYGQPQDQSFGTVIVQLKYEYGDAGSLTLVFSRSALSEIVVSLPAD